MRKYPPIYGGGCTANAVSWAGYWGEVGVVPHLVSKLVSTNSICVSVAEYVEKGTVYPVTVFGRADIVTVCDGTNDCPFETSVGTLSGCTVMFEDRVVVTNPPSCDEVVHSSGTATDTNGVSHS